MVSVESKSMRFSFILFIILLTDVLRVLQHFSWQERPFSPHRERDRRHAHQDSQRGTAVRGMGVSVSVLTALVARQAGAGAAHEQISQRQGVHQVCLVHMYWYVCA